ncbi:MULTISPECIES: LuxR C-terminal-related transcriptional regulator [unclassified Aeromicrobium]|jgi:DNA-binding CsgD family transcriptional regulator|uniref:helix-turn-helix transcriptional regulator n=1 Tax=unclassified Aeromicrobium TaxID=2633570 RepID=UPI000B1926E0|nr:MULTISPECIES: LuxR C-terminal-related transcriptional regulator [unclassified Aeromicrobium]
MPDHLAPQEILTRRLDDLRRVTGLPLVMGGLVRSREHFTISELRGALTTSLHQLRVRQGEGLGGKTLATRRPAAVSAYPRSAAITHRYDRWVAPERLQSVVSIPVGAEGRQPSAIVYLCDRRSERLGLAVVDAARPVLAGLAADLGAATAVEERMRAISLRAAPATDDPHDLARELRQVADLTTDPSTRARLEAVLARLPGQGARRPAGPHPLGRREVEVLRLAEEGATNVEIADALGLVESTVKSYMKSAMAKLGAENRVKAARAARTQGLLD